MFFWGGNESGEDVLTFTERITHRQHQRDRDRGSERELCVFSLKHTADILRLSCSEKDTEDDLRFVDSIDLSVFVFLYLDFSLV